MTEDDQIRAERARQLLEDEVLRDVFASLEKNIVDRLVATRVSDHETITALTAGLQATRALSAELRKIVLRGTEPTAQSRQFA